MQGIIKMIEQMKFTTHYEKGCPCYHETTFKAGNEIHLRLLDFLFRSKEVLGDDYSHIFPDNQSAHDFHKQIVSSGEFRPWNGWLFRGQKRPKLQTTFEQKYFDEFCEYKNEKTDRDLFVLEMGIIMAFKRTAGAFYPELRFVNDMDTYEYMSWIRHFGGLTRFMDVSNSFFVALFFAVARLFPFTDYDNKKQTATCSIWCFDKVWLELQYKKFLPEEIKEMYDKYDEFGKDVRIQQAILNYVPEKKKNSAGDKGYFNEFLSVIDMKPFYHNRRIIRQKGMFLMPTNPYRSFEDNLFNMVKTEEDAWHILKINMEFSRDEAIHLMKFLDTMNINESVLFENLEGICENLNNQAFFHDDSITVSPNAGINNSTSSLFK